MAALELIVYASVSAAVLTWAFAEAMASRLLWTMSAGLMVSHSVLAFIVFYGGSHTIARTETMRQTAALTGIQWPGGIYVNYVFLLVWSADVMWWWLNPSGYESRSRWVSWAIRGFIFFIIVNGAVIFADGAARLLGVVAVTAVLAAHWRRHREPGTLEPRTVNHEP